MPQCSVLHVQPSHSRRCSFPKLNIPGCSPSPSVTPHCATARPISCPKMEGLSFGLSWWDASRFLPPWMHAGAGDGSPVPCLSQPLCSFFLSEVAAFAQGVGVEQGGGGAAACHVFPAPLLTLPWACACGPRPGCKVPKEQESCSAKVP